MEYPKISKRCDDCGRSYSASDGGCSCDTFRCPDCDAVFDAEAPTFPRIHRDKNGTIEGRMVCFVCALCQDCHEQIGTVLEADDDGYIWLCARCAEEPE